MYRWEKVSNPVVISLYSTESLNQLSFSTFILVVPLGKSCYHMIQMQHLRTAWSGWAIKFKLISIKWLGLTQLKFYNSCYQLPCKSLLWFLLRFSKTNQKLSKFQSLKATQRAKWSTLFEKIVKTQPETSVILFVWHLLWVVLVYDKQWMGF